MNKPNFIPEEKEISSPDQEDLNWIIWLFSSQVKLTISLNDDNGYLEYINFHLSRLENWESLVFSLEWSDLEDIIIKKYNFWYYVYFWVDDKTPMALINIDKSKFSSYPFYFTWNKSWLHIIRLNPDLKLHIRKW